MIPATRLARSVPSMPRAAAPLLAGVFALALAGVAAADPKFPKMLKEEADMPCVPQCTVCHATQAGGFGNFKPVSLGNTLMKYGLNVADLNSIKAAVAQDEEDTDGDGVGDIDELAAGTDPNPGGGELCGEETPGYGCARVERRGSLDGAANLASGAALLAGGALLRRRRRCEVPGGGFSSSGRPGRSTPRSR